jgi:hypothetical protein
MTTVIQPAPFAPPMPAPVTTIQPPAPAGKILNHRPKNNANATIGTIFKATSTTNFNKTPSAKNILL